MNYLDFEQFVERCTDFLSRRINVASAEFGIRDLPRYEYDLYRGEIRWSEDNGCRS